MVVKWNGLDYTYSAVTGYVHSTESLEFIVLLQATFTGVTGLLTSHRHMSPSVFQAAHRIV